MKLFFIVVMLALTASGCKPKGTIAASNVIELSNSVAFSWGKTALTATNESVMSGVFNLLKRNQGEGKTTFDQANNPQETIFPDGIKFVHDGKNIVGIINTNGEKISLEYDMAFRVRRIVYPDGTFQKFHYSADNVKPSSMETGKGQ